MGSTSCESSALGPPILRMYDTTLMLILFDQDSKRVQSRSFCCVQQEGRPEGLDRVLDSKRFSDVLPSEAFRQAEEARRVKVQATLDAKDCAPRIR